MTDQDPVSVLGGPEKAREWIESHMFNAPDWKAAQAAHRLAILGIDAAALKAENEKLRAQRDAALAAMEAKPCNATTTLEGIAFGCVRSSHSDDDHAYAKAEPRAEPSAEPVIFDEAFEMTAEQWDKIKPRIAKRSAEQKPGVLPTTPCKGGSQCMAWVNNRGETGCHLGCYGLTPKPAAEPKRPGALSMIQCRTDDPLFPNEVAEAIDALDERLEKLEEAGERDHVVDANKKVADDGLRALRNEVAGDHSVGTYGTPAWSDVRKLALMLADRALGGGK